MKKKRYVVGEEEADVVVVSIEVDIRIVVVLGGGGGERDCMRGRELQEEGMDN